MSKEKPEKQTKKSKKAKDLMDLDKLKVFMISLNSIKEQAEFIKDLIVSHGAEALNLPAVPVSAIQDFIDDKRSNLWEITINGDVYITVNGDKESAETLLTLVTSAGQNEFVMEPLQLVNVEDYLLGKRDNVGQFEMVHNPEAKTKEELPGHLD